MKCPYCNKEMNNGFIRAPAILQSFKFIAIDFQVSLINNRLNKFGICASKTINCLLDVANPNTFFHKLRKTLKKLHLKW